EKFDFIRAKARKTKRLEQQIINISLNVSSITASNLINEEIADIGKSSHPIPKITAFSPVDMFPSNKKTARLA
uniref:hypothetical protein n=1 Tax=Anaerosporobacter sp. TaxID=1872529 RepID=UPI00286F3DF9